MAQLIKNQVYPALIEGYASDGSGVARIGGMAVFVRHALRGDRADVRIDHIGHNAAWGHVEALHASSPARQIRDCSSYGICGGCQFRHMTYEEELFAKRARVDDALARIGGLDLRTERVWGAEKLRGYRNKVQMPVAGRTIGYYRERSHDVVDVGSCLLQPERAEDCRRAVRAWMEEHRVPAYNEKKHTGLVRHLCLRFNEAGETLCCLVINGAAVPQPERLVEGLRSSVPGLAGVAINVNTRRTNVILGQETVVLWGRGWLEETLCGLTFRLSVPSFFQVNRAQTEVLYSQALEYAGLTGRETVLDLYCGIGSISLVMAREAGRVVGAEIVPQAIEDARANAARNGINNAEFFCGDAPKVAARLRSEGLRPHVITVDPPRKGLSPETPAILAALEPERMVYVSCDPATLARDLKRLGKLGYAAVRAEAVDLFPRTSHVETVVLLSKGEVDSKKIRVEFSLEDMDMSEFQDGATYPQIKEYVLEHTGLKVSNLYISQIKRKCGLEVGKNYNLPKSEDSRQPQCPPEKEKAIREAFKYFGMI